MDLKFETPTIAAHLLLNGKPARAYFFKEMTHPDMVTVHLVDADENVLATRLGRREQRELYDALGEQLGMDEAFQRGYEQGYTLAAQRGLAA